MGSIGSIKFRTLAWWTCLWRMRLAAGGQRGASGRLSPRRPSHRTRRPSLSGTCFIIVLHSRCAHTASRQSIIKTAVGSFRALTRVDVAAGFCPLSTERHCGSFFGVSPAVNKGETRMQCDGRDGAIERGRPASRRWATRDPATLIIKQSRARDNIHVCIRFNSVSATAERGSHSSLPAQTRPASALPGNHNKNVEKHSTPLHKHAETE